MQYTARPCVMLRSVVEYPNISASGASAEMFGYSTTLRSMTQGRAVYSMQFDHYEEVPKSVAEQIITKAKG